MATNPYFSPKVTSEQNLYEDIVIESLKMFGQDVYYIPRESKGYDKVWSDDIINTYNDTYRLEMYIENIEGFDGEGDLFTKFGIEIRDAATFIVSRRRWNAEVAVNEETDTKPFYRPREGDLIYLPMSQSTFEIQRVETEDPFFQLNNLPVFKMSCELYEYSGEDFDTGIEDIDRVEEVFGYQWRMVLSDSASGYIVGETVSQTLATGAIMSGEVVKWADSSNEIFVAHAGANDGKYHEFTTGLNVVGDKSSASFAPSLVQQINKIQEAEMNADFKAEALTFVDFTETNPFGDIDV